MTLPIGARKNHWEPVEWHPWYEQIVLELCMGSKNIEVARKYGLTKVHVCNINRTRQAHEIRQRVLAEIQSGSKFSIQDRMSAMVEKSIERVEAMLDNDTLFEEKPLAVSDRAFRFLEGMNKLKGQGGTNINNTQINQVNVPPESLDRFTKALESASQVRALHTGGNDAEQAESIRSSDRASERVRVPDGSAVEVGIR